MNYGELEDRLTSSRQPTFEIYIEPVKSNMHCCNEINTHFIFPLLARLKYPMNFLIKVSPLNFFSDVRTLAITVY